MTLAATAWINLSLYGLIPAAAGNNADQPAPIATANPEDSGPPLVGKQLSNQHRLVPSEHRLEEREASVTGLY